MSETRSRERFERSEKELTRVADARPRVRAPSGAFAEPLRDLRRSGRVEEKDARNGRLDAASSRSRTSAHGRARTFAIHASRSKPFPMTARARLATTRVPRARVGPDRASASAAAARSRVRA